MTKIMQKLAICAFSLSLTSCATLVNGHDEKVPVTTNPPGATVTEESTSELTPATLDLERNRDYMLTITKEGYKTETIKIQHVVSEAAAGNILSFGFLGTAIDTASGSLWKLEPDHIVVTLRPLTPDEQVDEANRLNAQTLQKQLLALDELKDAKLLTDNQYAALRDITIHCVQTG